VGIHVHCTGGDVLGRGTHYLGLVGLGAFMVAIHVQVEMYGAGGGYIIWDY
jgi:hypothetical protein